MRDHDSNVGPRRHVETVVQHALVVLTATAIVAAFGYEAHELAAEVGIVAYPLVFGVGIASYLLAQVGWRALTGHVDATVAREAELTEE